MVVLLLLFIVLPIVEIALLSELAGAIGWLPTILLSVGTGALGASLARHQGLGVISRTRAEAAAGRPPTEPLLEGVAIFLAGVLLIVPGILTDVVGFLLLVPPLRRAAVGAAVRRMQTVSGPSGSVHMSWRVSGSVPRVPDAGIRRPDQEIIDVEPTRVEGGEEPS